MSRTPAPDVLVMGEILLEMTSPERLQAGSTLTLGISGDALNVSAAAAAAGAKTMLLARVPSDDLGDEIVKRCEELGIDTSLIARGEGQHGIYLSHSDPEGEREFTYARAGSFGSTLEPGDLPARLVESAGVVTASGIATAISDSAAATVQEAAKRAKRFVYDPNFRPRLTSVERARRVLQQIAPHCEIVKPSYPGEATKLLDLPREASETNIFEALRRLGVRDVVMTRGSKGVVIDTDAGRIDIPVIPPRKVVDQTGAGDSFTGTMCARLALGDDLETAVRLGTAAASLCISGVGGTGFVPSLAETRAHLESAPDAPTEEPS